VDDSNEDRGPISGGFGRVDWLAFLITTMVVFAVYLFTLAPQGTLGFSGVFSTAAMHGGVPHPPGYPAAVCWQWAFVKLLPVSNVAWRVALSSAVAGALACGLIPLLVSRLGRERLENCASLTSTEAVWVRIVCGCVSGGAFAFNGAFWGRAVVADVWTFSVLLFCGALALLARWCWTPRQNRWLFAFAFVYGLSLTSSQILLAAALAMPTLMAVANRELARDVLMTGCVLFVFGLIEAWTGGPSIGFLRDAKIGSLLPLHIIVGLALTLAFVWLVVRTGRVLTEWKRVSGCGVAFVFGLTPYLYVPIASMANPPMNWGYARTVEGFLHLTSRGQYESIRPTKGLKTLAKQGRMYMEVTAKEFGWPFLVVALLPWLSIRRWSGNERAWMLGLFALYVCLTVLLIAVLNPVDHRDGRSAIKVFFTPSYVVLAIWSGLGLMRVAEGMRRRGDGDSSNRSRKTV
jgi:hypothetical protein